MRAELSPEQREALNKITRAAIVAARDNETVEERRRLDAEANRRGLHVKLKVKTEEEREERRRLDAEATRAARETRAETEELR